MNNKLQNLLQFLIIGACIGAGIIITPNSSTEPVDLPKLLVLTTLGFAVLGILFSSGYEIVRNVNRVFLVLIILFIIQMTLALTLSGAPFNQQFYGTFGRNTGFLAYVSLLGIAVASSFVASPNFLKRFAYSIIGIGAISICYDLLQTTGHDPVKWNNPYNPIIGFLGNPDFEASFLGMVGIVIVSMIVRKETSILSRVLTSAALIFLVFLIYRSAAQQGILVLLLGAAIVVIVYLFKSNNALLRRFSLPMLLAAIGAGIFVLLGSLKIGPLAGVLYKTSVRQRGFYWEAALNMMNKKPITGIGLDSYGDWYFRTRSIKAATITPLVQSNAAHNVFLDLGSNGGWPLFIINIALLIFVAICGIRVLRRELQFNWVFTGLFAAWVGFEAQALISINQLGIGVWGWALGGAIVGFEFKYLIVLKAKSPGGSEQKKGRRTKVEKYSLQATFALASGFIGFLLVFQLFNADMNYRKATISKSAESVISAALANPKETGRILQAAQLLASNKLNAQAIQLADEVLKINPDSYNALNLKYQLTLGSSPNAQIMLQRLRQLDPNGKH